MARWDFENAWPSKRIISPLPLPEGTPFRSIFDVQIDNLLRVPVAGTAPWPRILELIPDRGNPAPR